MLRQNRPSGGPHPFGCYYVWDEKKRAEEGVGLASSYGTDADKGSLRSNYLRARRRIDPATKLALDARIRQNLERLPEFAAAPLVLSYVSGPSEVDTRAVIEDVLAAGRRVAVPRVDPADRSMTFCEIESLAELAPGFRGIPEPAASAPALTTGELLGSACLVPGLVFGADGHRIGYGAGCYDRFLAFYPGHKIGLARGTQVSSNPLPIEPGDVPVDFVVTDAAAWACR